MPVSEVREGMIGTGYTVSKGTTPESFTAEVLGVMPDGIGPGRDMIVVDVASPAIDKAGGIWFGMSGSPVYVNNKLIGAVAYGLAFGPSTIGGLTAAEDMLEIAERPAAAGAEADPRKVELTPRMVDAVAATTGASAAQTSDTMKQLKTPLSVSGAGARGMRQVRKAVAREGLPLVPYAGSSVSADAVPAPAEAAPEPGGNFAGAISYGDVTFAGVGTTTYVCEGKVLAFGHPFFFLPQGKTSLGANAADAIAIVSDPTFGAYKLATVEGAYGTLDQDRFAGVRALLGPLPDSIPITSSVSADGAERDGETDVLDSDFVPFTAFIHLLSNIDFTRDAIGEGSSTLEWTVEGTRKSGDPWTLTRSNLFSSEFDIAYESIAELEQALYRIAFNEFEDVEFTSIDATTSVDESVKQYEITEVLVSKNGGEFLDVRRVRVRPGATIGLRVALSPFDGGADRVIDLELMVPVETRRDQFIEIKGGSGGGNFYYDEYCFGPDGGCGGSSSNIESFDDLLASLQDKAQNNELVAELRGGRGKVKASDLEVLDQVVSGFDSIFVRIKGVNSSGGGTTVSDGGGKG
jgi:hypothetical protein